MDPLGPQVLRADPQARRGALIALAAVLVIGVVTIACGLPAATDWLKRQPPAEALRILQWLALAAFVPMIPFGYFTWRQGQRILAGGQFPPPGTRVIVDTPIVTGREARARGVALKTTAVLLAVLGAAGAVVVPLLLERLLRGA
ncbi:MAG TPA: hypothetical protein VLW45_12485 [Pelomicrobium sp.]|nr:hypothetical protein [Pelomicrobium sp.]